MTLFLSTFVHKIDKKGRVSVPAHFRAALNQAAFSGIVLYRSLRVQALEGCGIDRFQQLSEHYDVLDLTGQSVDEVASFVFAQASMLPFDGEGRVLIPRPVLDDIHVTDELAFVGRGKVFEIWQPQLLQENQQSIREKIVQSIQLSTHKELH